MPTTISTFVPIAEPEKKRRQSGFLRTPVAGTESWDFRYSCSTLFAPPLGFTDQQKAALGAFLKALSNSALERGVALAASDFLSIQMRNAWQVKWSGPKTRCVQNFQIIGGEEIKKIIRGNRREDGR
jgi:hypothetical protein